MAPRKPLILLVDDFDDARDIYATYFAHHGYPVDCAANGQEAIDAARVRRPGVILLDLRMPGLTGTEAMLALRADAEFKDVPIVAFTAHALDDERAAALRAGFDAVIAKPCLPDDLLRLVELLLTRWENGQPQSAG